MKVENQVCTEFQAKKLKGLGVIAKSVFLYEVTPKHGVPANECGEARLYYPSYNTARFSEEYQFAAFTSSELMVMLPDNRWAVGYRYGQLDLKSDVFTESKIVITKYDSGYEIAIVSLEGTELFSIRGLDLAVACAEMLIYLLEHGLISVDVVNQQIQAA